MEFLRPQFAPPGGVWPYVDEASGKTFESRVSLDDVVSQVTRFLKANGREVPAGLRAGIEDWICQRMPPGVCSGEGGLPKYETLPSFFEVSKATDEMFHARRWELCSPAVAEDRARVCIPCRRHSLRLCTTCDGLRKVARDYVRGRRTRFDAQLGVCMVFRVPTVGLIHVEGLTRGEGCPEKCWVTA